MLATPTRFLRFTPLALAAVVLAAVATACAGGDEVAARPTIESRPPLGDAHDDSSADEDGTLTVSVRAEKIAFSPNEIRIQAGQTVRVVLENVDPVLHDFTVDDVKFVVLEESGAEHGDHSSGAAEHDDEGHEDEAAEHDDEGHEDEAAEHDDEGHEDEAAEHDDEGHEDEAAEHDDEPMLTSLHVAADANSDAVLVFTAMEPGVYEVYCTVPGHKDAGMVATIIVE